MANKNVCATCGNGASARLLDNLKDDTGGEDAPKKRPPKRKTKREKTQEWARSVLQRYK